MLGETRCDCDRPRASVHSDRERQRRVCASGRRSKTTVEGIEDEGDFDNGDGGSARYAHEL
eukprot:8308889-Pyramimonas_sp.AAC.1